MNRKIIFDLDGTLIDSRQRLYKLFCDLVPGNGLTFEKYWALKRSMRDHEWILKELCQYSAEMYASFSAAWMEKIESREYLAYDAPFSFTVEVLTELKTEGYELHIATHRHKPDAADWQLKHIGIDRFFSSVFFAEPGKKKSEVIRHSGISLDPSDIFVGDTGVDIQAGRDLGMRSFAVTSGFRDSETLSTYNPTAILNNISELKTLIFKERHR